MTADTENMAASGQETRGSAIGLWWIALAAMVLVSCLQHAWYWTQLPERVAIHFGPEGKPDNWASRDAATGLLLSLQVLMPLSLVGIAYALAYMPVSLINMPNREYWLTGPRRRGALQYMRSWMMAMATLTGVFMMAMAHLTFVANMQNGALNNQMFLVILGIYLGLTLGMVVLMYRRFRMPKDAAGHR